MSNLQELIANRIGENAVELPTVPMSFRCSPEALIKADVLSKLLDYSTRSKFLADIVPAAIDDALAHLPSNFIDEFKTKYAAKLNELYEEHHSQE